MSLDNSSKKAIIIGSGFGGLAIAIRLQTAGYSVTILEKNEKIGGRANQIIDRGYTFDMGPSLVTAPELFDQLFELCGKRREDYVDLIPLDPYYRIYFDQGNSKERFISVDYNGDPEHMKQELEKLEKGAGLQYDAYFKKLKPLYEIVYKQLSAKPFLTLGSFLKILPQMISINAVSSVASLASKFFKVPFTQRMYSFHPLYIGANPNSAPGAVGFIPYLERTEGVWFAKGGMYSVVKALGTIFEESGGKIVCNSEVSEIQIDDVTKMVKSIRTKSGENYECDLVVSNGDVLNTYELINNPDATVEKRKSVLKKQDYSMSLYLLYFGLKKQYHDKLAHHTLILGKEYDELLEEIFKKKIFPTSLSMYLHIPSVTDPTMAPDGCESMYVLVPMPNLSGSVEWSRETSDKVRNWVVSYLEKEFVLEGFADAIEVEHRFIPTDFENTLASYLGAAFAAELTTLQSVYFRQHNRSDEFKNLYFVGAGTHPGPGVPGVLKSAECTATIILS